jgi:uncharacterized protein
VSAPEAPANRLAHSTSPYLRQHAHNFVDWYEWGPEALARARAEDKPILLSVGYSACHWCHVMAHECFDDPAIAARMNEHFINIKVDREERPDIDAIYQKVVALLGQGGGWPLTVFLTPNQQPFYGGTYFPPADRYGRPGFPRVLDALATLWAERREEALEQAEAFMGGLADIASSVDEDADVEVELPLSSPTSLAEASRRLLAQIDPEWGGFGRAPKFPNVPSLELLLRAVQAEQAAAGAAEALASTLEKMWRGGIYDHLRGGFARYSVDREWLIPHFEKMLYDNALLLGLYADASVVLGATRERAFLRRVVEETAAYLLADMRDDRGRFYSATDADSEGVEGKYFCWTPAQLDEVLGPALGRTFARAFGVTEAGNFEHGMSVLHRPQTLTASLEAELEPARAKLLEHRYGRVPPLRDEKVITAWNALVISGFCKAASAAERWGAPERAAAWIEVARTTCAELLRTHRDADARLLRASWQGRGHTRAFLEDVGLLARACLDVHELTLEPRWQAEAEALARECLEHYAREGGGFYEAADDGEALIERTESRHDSPLPSGLAAAVEVLARLDLAGASLTSDALTGRAAVEQTLRRFHRASARPFAYAGLIAAAQWASERAAHVSVRAASPEAGQALASVVRRAKPTIPTPVALSFELAPESARPPTRPEALVCRAQSCSLPLGDPEALLAALSEVPHDPRR